MVVRINGNQRRWLISYFEELKRKNKRLWERNNTLSTIELMRVL